jgi:transcriptional regulator
LVEEFSLMYIPPAFVERDSERLALFLAEHGFASLVTTVDGRPVATHLPLLFEASDGALGALVGHLARGNPQWRAGEGEGLAIFSGPHAYISAAHYEAENTVPTWNYVAVHVTGRVTYFDEPERLREILRRTVEKYESPRATPWAWNESSDYSGKLVGEIVGVHLAIERIDGAWKLNQHHPVERRRRVIDGLEREGGEGSLAIAELMRATLTDSRRDG